MNIYNLEQELKFTNQIGQTLNLEEKYFLLSILESNCNWDYRPSMQSRTMMKSNSGVEQKAKRKTITLPLLSNTLGSMNSPLNTSSILLETISSILFLNYSSNIRNKSIPTFLLSLEIPNTFQSKSMEEKQQTQKQENKIKKIKISKRMYKQIVMMKIKSKQFLKISLNQIDSLIQSKPSKMTVRQSLLEHSN